MSNVNAGIFNFPQIMRRLGHRTKQVRDVVFVRDPIFQKSIRAIGTTTGTEGSGSTLAGPPVSFGYEEDDYTSQTETTTAAYHHDSPEIVLPGLQVYQTPIVSRSGKLERGGHRITGSCKFYTPPLSIVRELNLFKDIKAFGEFETNDMFIDREKIVLRIPDNYHTSGSSNRLLFKCDDYQEAYEMDRIHFRVRASGLGTYFFCKIMLWAKLPNNDDSGLHDDMGSAIYGTVDKDGNMGTMTTDDVNCTSIISAASNTCFNVPITDEWIQIDLPLRVPNAQVSVPDADVTGRFENLTSTFKNGTMERVDMYNYFNYDPEKMFGDSTANIHVIELWFNREGGSVADIEIKDIYIYKEAQWVIDSIKDYRDEYMAISALRIRGDRISRRRAYG